MVTGIFNRVDIMHLKRAIFCKDLRRVNIGNSSVLCGKTMCQCIEHIQFSSILEFYANLYYILNNENVATYDHFDIRLSNEIDKIRNEVESNWQEHVKEFPYHDIFHQDFHPETLELFNIGLNILETKEELLIYLFSWLFQLDKHLISIKRDYQLQKPSEYPIPTCRGDLIFKHSSALYEYVEEDPDREPVRDSNYLFLRRFIKNFHLVKPMYEMHSVKHLDLDISLSNDEPEKIKIGFLPGQANVSRDYIITTGHVLHDETIPFFFVSVKLTTPSKKDRRIYNNSHSSKSGLILNILLFCLAMTRQFFRPWKKFIQFFSVGYIYVRKLFK